MCDRLRDFLRGQYGIEASDGRTQVLWREVGIAHYHRQGAVPEQIFQLGQGRAPLNRPRGEGVAEVVKPEVLQPGRRDRDLPVPAEGVPAPCVEHEAVTGCLWRPAGQDGVRWAVQG